jgi:hypothetical protein
MYTGVLQIGRLIMGGDQSQHSHASNSTPQHLRSSTECSEKCVEIRWTASTH